MGGWIALLAGTLGWLVHSGRVTSLSGFDRAAVNAMKHCVVVVGLVWEPSVVQEHIMQALAALRLMCYTNRGASLQNWSHRPKATAF